MNFIDILLGVLILYGVIKGFINGFFVEAASLIALIAGIFGAIHFSYLTGNYLTQYLEWEEKYINLAAFAVTFIVIILAITLLGKVLTKLANIAALGFINKIMGSVFGGLKFIVVLGGLLIFLSRIDISFPLTDQDSMETSLLYSPVKNIGGLLFQIILEDEAVLQAPETIPESI
ncbi:CvpA family protein [Robertkochia flava]|uniref:CvpA family protein n=1 Tax=Robertkochia flava TaxID=3447986 RepID=UPI001CCD3BC8|nr:CvpA family protein [Robertkochia marina]